MVADCGIHYCPSDSKYCGGSPTLEGKYIHQNQIPKNLLQYNLKLAAVSATDTKRMHIMLQQLSDPIDD